MIAIEKLKAVRTIVTYESCPDGIASAILLHDALPGARIVFAQYGTRALAELAAEPGMLFCDFAPPPDRVQPFLDAGALVLDHHKSARAIVEAFGADAVFGDEAANPGVSGATLAEREVWRVICGPSRSEAAGTAARELARIAGVRDTWQRQDPSWDAACAQAEALRFYPVNHWLELKDPFASGHPALLQMLKVGELLVEKHAMRVKRAIERSWRATTKKGTRLVVFEGLSLTSDAAEALDKETDLVVGFGYEVDNGAGGAAGAGTSTGAPKAIFSTRSHTGYDCAALAKHYGGGGHSAAAGFGHGFVPGDPEAGMRDPYSEVLGFVEGFEGLAKG